MKQWVAFILGLSLAMASLPTLGEDMLPKKTTALLVVNDHINQIQKNIAEEQSRQNKLSKELKTTETNLGNINQRINKNQTRLIELEDQLSRLHDAQEAANDKLFLQKEALEKQIRATYLLGQQPYIKMLLNQENPTKISRILSYYQFLHQDRLRLISDLNNAVIFLNSNEQDMLEKKKVLKQVQDDLRQDKVTFEKSKFDREQLLVKINAHLQDDTQRLLLLKEDKNHLEKTLYKLQHARTALQPSRKKNAEFDKLKSKLDWPTRGNILKRYGTPIESSDLTWNGTLIKAHTGEDVRAIHAGKVVFSGWMRGFGLLIIIDHGDQYMSLYGRNSTLFKKIGDTVASGELIAKVGQSGGYLESSLYFEIRHKGKPENPEIWCKRNTNVKIA